MLRYASWALLLLLVLGFVLALLPSPSVQAAQGVKLMEVSMKLYPQQDPDAVWEFHSKDIQYDPIEGKSVLNGTQTGKRMVKGELDMTVTAPGIEIDRTDNLHMKEAVLNIPKQCTTLKIQKDVTIDQASGFSGKQVQYRAANMDMTADAITAPFDLGADTQMTRPRFVSDLDAPETCVGGAIVEKPEDEE
ncbi:hypothetical protein [Deinococcus cellulosilyticus]|uniref:Lipid/polyisoprenoid-binding YceI-like domain-containing protein n=1 Tax=Deinococcus cellulosilyticus (strain DSM 18568 / NBRC 106333 / KACC 11606 / 5516J-15) TaxID=1223518 RepID=A0A511N6R4_DEIC1|nr:hypothetical protein [Deinococcus cellulosilyticus]GEM48101.1 hypothetical protein DC3_37360 [Deinococcus cellulosilyticus NBRC 106333 = KACC 11606]